MIHIKRNAVPKPGILQSEFVRKSLADVKAFNSLSVRARRQRRFGLTLMPIYEPVAAALKRLFHNKCAYCESPLGSRGKNCIGHYRPPRNTLGQDGETYSDHYWWLAFKWDNLLFCCSDCSRMKGNRFPIDGPRAEILAGSNSLKGERPMVLNPCVDRPEKHLTFDQIGRAIFLSPRGEITLKVLGLNRASLLEQRAQIADRLTMELNPNFKPSMKELRKWLPLALDRKQPFLGLRRVLIRKWLESWLEITTANELSEELIELAVVPTRLPVLTHPIPVPPLLEISTPSIESSNWQEKRAYYSQLRTIERVEIENFKGISHLKIEMPRSSSDSESWVMFLGENGTGKSSVLQGIALALLGQKACNALRLDGREFVRRGAQEGRVRVWFSNVQEPVMLTFSNQHHAFRIFPPEPSVLLLGFGATRLLPRTRHTQAPSRRSNRVKNLFDPFARLNHAERWLIDRRAVSDEQFNRIAIALKKLLMLTDEHQFSRDQDRVWVKLHGPKVTLSELSDGYQSIVVMAVNIIMGVADRWKEIELAEGVVLIDELEVHLHPIWKMEIVGLLRQMFPKMTFLVTTHDPLCLRGLQPGEVVVLRIAGDRIQAQVITESLAHFRADQLLTSPLFGLYTTRDQSVTSDVDRYSKLLSKKNRNAVEEQEFRRLQVQLETKLQPGETESKRLVAVAVRKTLHEVLLPQVKEMTDAKTLNSLDIDSREALAQIFGSDKPATA